MSKKTWIIFASIVIILLGGLIALAGKNKINVGDVDTGSIITASSQSGNIGDHVFGNKDSKVTIIEYGDFQCPGCGNAYPNLKAATEKYKDDITFIFRNLPLPTLHANARAAAATAEAAGLQGKYWEMFDQLYANQSDWENLPANKRLDFFTGYAKDLGLDTARFTTDFASDNVNKKISYDGAVFAKTKLEKSTPTILINGVQVQSDVWSDPTKMEQAIASELKAQGVTPAADTKKN